MTYLIPSSNNFNTCSEKTGTWYRDTRNTYPVVHRMHIYSGKLRKVEALPHRGASVFADRDGELRYLTWADEEATLRSAYREQGGDEWKDAALLLASNFGFIL